MCDRPNIPAPLENEDGQVLVEYSLVILLVVLVVISALTTIGTTVNNMLSAVLAGF
jgi:Flp pilus assembly pilin Flp